MPEIYNLIAFDPIFFLHHCNVDRLYAFWAYVYPDAWMDKGFTAIVNNQEVEGYKFCTYFYLYFPFAFHSHSNAYLGDVEGTFDLQDNSNIDNLTELTPFRTNASGNPYWNSDGVKTTGLLNYTYPILAGVDLQKEVNPVQREVCHLNLQQYFQSLLDSTDALRQPPPSTPSFLLQPNPVRALMAPQIYRHFTVIVKANEWSFDMSHSVL